MQVPAVAEHASPSPTHSSSTQQPPPLQAWPGQQFSPPQEVVAVPQLPSVQVVVAPHIVPAPAQVPRTQQPPAAQVVSPQQG